MEHPCFKDLRTDQRLDSLRVKEKQLRDLEKELRIKENL